MSLGHDSDECAVFIYNYPEFYLRRFFICRNHLQFSCFLEVEYVIVRDIQPIGPRVEALAVMTGWDCVSFANIAHFARL